MEDYKSKTIWASQIDCAGLKFEGVNGYIGGGVLIMKGKGSQYRRRGGKRVRITLRISEKVIRKIILQFIYLKLHMSMCIYINI